MPTLCPAQNPPFLIDGRPSLVVILLCGAGLVTMFSCSCAYSSLTNFVLVLLSGKDSSLSTLLLELLGGRGQDVGTHGPGSSSSVN